MKIQSEAPADNIFDFRELILKHWVPKDETIPPKYYIEVLKFSLRKIAA